MHMDSITCKCGARSYEEHLKAKGAPHTYKANKATSQIRK